MRDKIKDYIAENLQKGYHINRIRERLLEHGHAQFVVDEAIKEVQYAHAKEKFSAPHHFEDVVKKAEKSIRLNHWAMFFVLAFVALMLFTAAGSKVSFGVVVFAFLPTILVMVTAAVAKKYLPNRELAFMWIAPLVVIILFILFAQSGITAITKSMDIFDISGLNLIISYIYLALVLLQKVEKPRKDLKAILNRIKAGSEKLNRAIGRVYSTSHGGSDDLRQKIHIDTELYHKVSGFTEEDIKNHADAILILVRMLEESLKRLQRPEKEVLGEDSKKLEELKRDHAGEDKVIVVLEGNTGEELQSVYTDTIKACDELRDYIKKP